MWGIFMNILTSFNRMFFLKFIIVMMYFPCIVNADISSRTQMIVFGDSLVDTGNDPVITFIQAQPNGISTPGLVIPPPTRYDRGRFSNGPVIVDYLAVKMSGFVKPSENGFNLKKDHVSYAYGGSETGVESYTPGLFLVPGLKGQLLRFEGDLKGGNINNDVLFLIWTGGNDYLNSFMQGRLPDPFQIVNNIVSSVDKLVELGAEKIVVINLPDLGVLPICQLYGGCEQLSDLTEIHNDLLYSALMHYEKVMVFDAHSIVDKMLMNPIHFGFSDNVSFGPATGCLFQLPAEFNIENCSKVSFETKNVFWDEIHPTTRVHKILARKLLRRLRD